MTGAATVGPTKVSPARGTASLTDRVLQGGEGGQVKPRVVNPATLQDALAELRTDHGKEDAGFDRFASYTVCRPPADYPRLVARASRPLRRSCKAKRLIWVN